MDVSAGMTHTIAVLCLETIPAVWAEVEWESLQ